MSKPTTTVQNGKGSKRRNEDADKVRDNYDDVFANGYVPPWKRRLLERQQAEKERVQ